MSVVGRLLGLERRAITPQNAPSLMLPADTRGASGHSVTVETALGTADVYSCIRAITDTGSTIPLHVYQRAKDGGRSRYRVMVPGSVSYLLAKPSPHLTPSTFVETALANLNTHGIAIIAKFRDGNTTASRVSQLAFIDPRRVAVALVGGVPTYSVAPGTTDLVEGVFGPEDILHIKAMSLDGLIGLSPIAQARDALSTAMALEDAAGRDFANGTAPAGVIQTKAKLDDEALDRLRRDWEAMYRGTKNRGRVAFLEDGWEWKSVSSSASDAQFVEQRRLSSTQVARIFRVPPYMIGADAGSSMTYANVEQALTAFLTHTIRPWLVKIEEALQADPDLFGIDSDLYPEFELDAILRADAATRANVYSVAVGRPYMTVNEARQRENLPALPGEDGLSGDAPTPTPAAA